MRKREWFSVGDRVHVDAYKRAPGDEGFGIPEPPINKRVFAGVVIAVRRTDPYPYEVALDDIDPGPKGVGHHYCFRWHEVYRA